MINNYNQSQQLFLPNFKTIIESLNGISKMAEAFADVSQHVTKIVEKSMSGAGSLIKQLNDIFVKIYELIKSVVEINTISASLHIRGLDMDIDLLSITDLNIGTPPIGPPEKYNDQTEKDIHYKTGSLVFAALMVVAVLGFMLSHQHEILAIYTAFKSRFPLIPVILQGIFTVFFYIDPFDLSLSLKQKIQNFLSIKK